MQVKSASSEINVQIQSHKAPESHHVEKARRKLLEQFARNDSKITPEALQKVSDAIKDGISKNSDGRIDLGNKDVTKVLNYASVKSRFICNLLAKLQKQVATSLEGRISQK